MGFYNIGSRGTISGPEEGDFDPEAACKKLHDGMKGLGTDENAIIETLPKHTNEQRQEIKKKYKTMYGKELVDELEKELGGSFAKVALALLQEPEEFIIDCVHRSIEGLGTDEYSLMGLLCVRSNDELAEMKTQYKEKYGKEMEEAIAEELSGDLKTLVVGLMNGGRDESETIDEDKVKQDAKDLLEAASGAGTKEEVFAAIFNQRNASHMRDVFDSYKEIADGKELEETIESEFSGNLQNAYLALIKIFRNVVAFHAERLRSAIKGAGTDDDNLIQMLVTRSEIDLKDILEFYEGKYDSRLVDDVSADTSGDYGVILQRILDESPSDSEAATAEEPAAEAPEGAEEAPAEVEEAPVESEDAAAESEGAPAEAEETATETEEVPAETEEATEVEAPAESEEAPAETEEAPAESEDAPAEGEEAAEESKEGEETEETGGEVEEAPVEAEEAPTEAEGAPTEGEDAAADGDAPAESEETPAEETTTETEAEPTEETNADATANGDEEAAAEGDAEKEAETADGDEADAKEEGEEATEGDAAADPEKEAEEGESKTEDDVAEKAETEANDEGKSDAKVDGK